jgi:hypothetical protein
VLGRLPIEVSRLRLELRRALEDARSSRARLALSTAAERQRLARDLHDGAQQQIITVGNPSFPPGGRVAELTTELSTAADFGIQPSRAADTSDSRWLSVERVVERQAARFECNQGHRCHCRAICAGHAMGAREQAPRNA